MIPFDSSGNCKIIKTLVKKCGGACSVLCAAALVMVVFLFIAAYAVRSVSYVQIIYIDSETPSSVKTSPKFLSIGLDSFVIAEGFKNFNMTNITLVKMIGHLHPAYLRIGGNLADKLHFSDNSMDKEAESFYRESNYFGKHMNYHLAPNYTMTGPQWLKLMKMAQRANLDVIFDLNSLIRFENGSWDYRNAESLIKFSNRHKLKLNWELGNEPNSFRHKFHEVVNATQMAKDFTVLKGILNEYPMYNRSLLVGPDTTRPLDKHKESEVYLRDFTKNIGDVVDAVTWHQYYMNGRTAHPEDFLNPEIMDLLELQIYIAQDIIHSSHHTKIPIWLGETASAYGGGAPNLSDTFIGSFIWIDKLGVAAKMGLDVIIRQSIYRGYYALLDENYNPNPDWWISILYKKFVGTKVVPLFTVCNPRVRLYCHCGKKDNFYDHAHQVTVFGLNMDHSPANMRIEGLFPLDTEEVFFSTVYAFELTSDSLFSKNIYLNGKLLKMSRNHNLPIFVPKKISPRPFVTMPPYSVVFWIIPNTHVKACSSN